MSETAFRADPAFCTIWNLLWSKHAVVRDLTIVKHLICDWKRTSAW